MERLEANFAGPLCLYQVLEERRLRNPSFLSRNLPFKPRRKSSPDNAKRDSPAVSEIDVHLDFELISKALVTLHHLVFEKPTVDGESPQIRVYSSQSRDIENQRQISQRVRLVPAGSPQFLVVFFATDPAKQSFEMHTRWIDALCKKLTFFPFRDHPPQNLTIHLQVPSLFLDISSFVHNVDRKLREAISFSFFLYEVGTNTQSAVFSRKLRSNVNFEPNAQEPSVRFSASVCHPVVPRITEKAIGKKEDSGELVVHYTAVGEKLETSVWRDSFPVFKCPWCSMMKPFQSQICFENGVLSPESNNALNALLNHIAACHDHFAVEVVVSALQKHVHFIVQRRLMTKECPIVVQHKLPWDFYYPDPKRKRRRRASGVTIAESSEPGGKKTLSFSASSLTSSSQTHNTLDVSNFFLPATGQRLRPADALVKDADIDISHEIVAHHLMIDEYSDLTIQEKELMKMWNEHISSSHIYGDRLIPVICELFVRRFGKEIATRNLRHNLLLHFMSMWDFGLLLAEEVEAFMKMADAAVLAHAATGSAITNS